MIGKPFKYGLLASVALMISTNALATNGYFGHGYGTKNKGLVGGGVALPQDAMITATNPAGLAFVGERADLGVAVFSPSPRSVSNTAGTTAPDTTPCGAFPTGQCPFTLGGVSTAQTIESENDYFLIPHFAMSWVMGAQTSAGISVYGNGGMNTEYQGGQAQHDDGSAFPAPGNATTTPGVFGAGTTGVNLEQLFINATLAHKMNDSTSVGFSAIFAYQRFEAKGLGTFQGFSVSPTNLTNKGVDDSFGYGMKLGIQSELIKGLTLAASYQSKIDMNEFDKYSGLFAEGGDFDIPATWTAGLALKFTPATLFTFAVQQIKYSGVKAIANPMNNLINPSGCAGGNFSRCLGGSDGAGFGWRDMTIFKFGMQWEASPDWILRAGYSHGKQPIPESEVVFNILAPAVIEDHITFGFTYAASKTSELNFAFMHALENSVTGTNPLNPSQQVTLEMTQNEAEVSWAWKF